MIELTRPSRKPDFSLAMINVVFLLLLFFLAVGTLVKANEIEIDVPITEALPLEKLPRPLLAVSSTSSISLDGAQIERAQIKESLLAKLQEGSRVHILADNSLLATQVLEIIADVESGGFSAMIVTLRDK